MELVSPKTHSDPRKKEIARDTGKAEKAANRTAAHNPNALASFICEVRAETRLTTQAQRPGPRGRSIATWTRWPDSLQRMVDHVVMDTPSSPVSSPNTSYRHDEQSRHATRSNKTVCLSAHHETVYVQPQCRAHTR